MAVALRGNILSSPPAQNISLISCIDQVMTGRQSWVLPIISFKAAQPALIPRRLLRLVSPFP